LRSKQRRQLLNYKKAIFEIRRWTDIRSDNAETIFEVSCRAFRYKKLLIKL